MRICRSPDRQGTVACRRKFAAVRKPLPPRALPRSAGARGSAGVQTAGPRATLAMMVREPRAGRVKTRLARDVGVVAATHFYRHAAASLATRLGRDRRWRLLLAVTPDIDTRSRAWPAHLPRAAQRGGDLGARLHRLFRALPPGPVVVIGSDSPAIRPHHIGSAFRALGAHDAAIGPAPDGGYWLIGLKRFPRVERVFDRVRWSTSAALADTLANLSGKRVAMLDEIADVDDAASLARHGGGYARRVPAVRD